MSEENNAGKFAIVDYGMGNVQSVANAFEVLGFDVCVTRDSTELQKSDALVLPGVGAFPKGMQNLRDFGLIPVLNEMVLHRQIPFLGICLGMQLIAKTGFEIEECSGLGWVDAEVVKLESEAKGLKIPHVGWNDAEINRSDGLLGESGETKSFYFVHSYHVCLKDKSVATAVSNHGIDFTSALRKGNIFATQFHPEKSQKHGLEFLKKFALLATHPREVSHA